MAYYTERYSLIPSAIKTIKQYMKEQKKDWKKLHIWKRGRRERKYLAINK